MVLSLAMAFAPSGAVAEEARWPVQVTALLAADATFYAPDDFKRQLARNRGRLMQGVADAFASDARSRDAAAHRAAAARGSRAVAAMIRRFETFANISYELGGVLYEVSAANPPTASADAGALTNTARRASFLGYPREPFRDPEELLLDPLSKVTLRERYDAAVTYSTRLIAWIWKTAGGETTTARKSPEAKGPYVVRE